ncbi:hypothetical protein Q675_02935 [Labrenzia sp. C1B70]|nr:hypothetical protein Q675_02935 [Labrenzia sp. C1B70]
MALNGLLASSDEVGGRFLPLQTKKAASGRLFRV